MTGAPTGPNSPHNDPSITRGLGPDAYPAGAVYVLVPEKPKEPLSFDRLQQVMAQHFGGRELTDDEADSAEAFARAVEKAHGIGA